MRSLPSPYQRSPHVRPIRAHGTIYRGWHRCRESTGRYSHPNRLGLGHASGSRCLVMFANWDAIIPLSNSEATAVVPARSEWEGECLSKTI